MPIPKPNEGESQNDFISRCMGDAVMVSEFPDEAQRRGVCSTAWEKKEDPTTQYITMYGTPKVIDADNRILEVTISTRDEDRDGDVVETAGLDFKNFQDNPVVLWAHDLHSPPIGKVLKIEVFKDHATALVQFATTEKGLEVWKLYAEGYLRAWSIGFIPDIDKATARKNGGFNILAAEVVELSAVPVPSNPRALSHMIAEDKIKEKSLKEDLTNAIWETGTRIIEVEWRGEYDKEINSVVLEAGCMERTIRERVLAGAIHQMVNGKDVGPITLAELENPVDEESSSPIILVLEIGKWQEEKGVTFVKKARLVYVKRFTPSTDAEQSSRTPAESLTKFIARNRVLLAELDMEIQV